MTASQERDACEPNYEILRPHRWGSAHVEPFEDYLPRAQPLLPIFPPEVLEDWVYRHFQDAIDAWGWLGFSRLSFVRDTWPAAEILENVRATRQHLIDGWAWSLINNAGFRRTWLGRQMIETGTWPVAPIVLSNANRLFGPSGELLHRFHLMEGHHRLAYLHALVQHPEWQPRSEHDLWLVTVSPVGDTTKDAELAPNPSGG